MNLNIKDFLFDKNFKIIIYDGVINIVNYEKIITLEETRISFMSSSKIITIKGEGLSIRKMLENEVLITGKYSEGVFNEI